MMKSFVLVSKETSEKLWGREMIWETFDQDNKFIFLCGECSIKEIKKLGTPNDAELEKIWEETEKTMDTVIDLPSIPERFKNVLFMEDLDWTYRLLPNALIICEYCRKTII